MQNYICKIATIEEMNIKWDYEISIAINNKENWIITENNYEAIISKEIFDKVQDIFG